MINLGVFFVFFLEKCYVKSVNAKLYLANSHMFPLCSISGF